MRFLLDESADFPLADVLSQLGHDVKAIARDYPNALKDEVVLAIANEDERIHITNDHDFGELIFRRQLSHAGVMNKALAEMFRYNAWANSQLFAACRSLGDEQSDRHVAGTSTRVLHLARQAVQQPSPADPVPAPDLPRP